MGSIHEGSVEATFVHGRSRGPAHAQAVRFVAFVEGPSPVIITFTLGFCLRSDRYCPQADAGSFPGKHSQHKGDLCRIPGRNACGLRVSFVRAL